MSSFGGVVSSRSEADGYPTEYDSLHPSAEASLSVLLSGLAKKEVILFLLPESVEVLGKE